MSVNQVVKSETVGQHGTSTTIPPRQRGERGSGSTITIDLSDHPDLLAKIRAAAKNDDREPSKWLRRVIVRLGTTLFDTEDQAKAKEK